MEAAGGSIDDIASVKVYVRYPEYMKYINPHWLKMFPDEDNRPARHTTIGRLKAGVKVQIEMTAVL
ncbi:MAG: RidA family protein [Bacillota bacterium]